MKTLHILALASLLALVPSVALASPAGLDTRILADDAGYLVGRYVADIGGTVTFTNFGLREHDVVSVARGPDANPWCGNAAPGRCPLFASPLVGIGQSATVSGTHQLEPAQSYAFYCSLHPWMTGTLTAI